MPQAGRDAARGGDRVPRRLGHGAGRAGRRGPARRVLPLFADPALQRGAGRGRRCGDRAAPRQTRASRASPTPSSRMLGEPALRGECVEIRADNAALPPVAAAVETFSTRSSEVTGVRPRRRNAAGRGRHRSHARPRHHRRQRRSLRSARSPFARAVLDAGGDRCSSRRGSSMVDTVEDRQVRASAATPRLARRGARPVFGRALGFAARRGELTRRARGVRPARHAADVPGVLEACARGSPDVVGIHRAGEFAGGARWPSISAAARTGRVSLARHRGMTVAAPPRAASDGGARGGRARARPRRRGDRRARRTWPRSACARSRTRSSGLRTAPLPRSAAAATELPGWWPGDRRAARLRHRRLRRGGHSASSPAVYRAAVDALAGLGRAIAASRRGSGRIGELGAVPANVHIKRWVPQADVMPRAAAMVVHGGFGTVRAALCAGVPLAVVPLFADQPYNARRVAAWAPGSRSRAARPQSPAWAARSARCSTSRPTARAHPRSPPTAARPPVSDAVAALGRSPPSPPDDKTVKASCRIAAWATTRLTFLSRLVRSRDAAPSHDVGAEPDLLPPDLRLRLPLRLRDDRAGRPRRRGGVALPAADGLGERVRRAAGP